MPSDFTPVISRTDAHFVSSCVSRCWNSDGLIAHFASLKGADPKDPPTLQAYKDGPFSELMRLFKENRELKQSQPS